MEAAGRRWIIYPSRSDVFTIWNLADLHVLNRAVALDRLRADIETIRSDPFSFWFGGGDYAEYISPTDHRFDAATFPADMPAYELARLADYAKEQLVKLLKPIAPKCLGALFGNHEYRYRVNKEQYKLHDWLCVELGIPNLEYCALVDVIFCRGAKLKLVQCEPKQMLNRAHHAFRFFLHHGAGFAQTPGGKLNRLTQFMDSFDADIYFVAHVHDQAGKIVVQLGADRTCEKIIERRKVGVITGTYLRTYAQGVTTYAEIKGYRPAPLGARFVRITPDKREITAEI